MFISTKPSSYGENRKAEIKNYNLPFLQHMYMGNPDMPLQCLITKTSAFVKVPDIITGQDKIRFRLDFNHIRQEASDNRHAGKSLDKSGTPSAIFRENRFDQTVYNKRYLFEFMTILPVCEEYHSYISQDSAKGNITLLNYKKEYWPWILSEEKNYNEFCKIYNIEGIPYELIIDHLSNINHPSIFKRLSINTHNKWMLV